VVAGHEEDEVAAVARLEVRVELEDALVEVARRGLACGRRGLLLGRN
jgi:hypothetical protein